MQQFKKAEMEGDAMEVGDKAPPVDTGIMQEEEEPMVTIEQTTAVVFSWLKHYWRVERAEDIDPWKNHPVAFHELGRTVTLKARGACSPTTLTNLQLQSIQHIAFGVKTMEHTPKDYLPPRQERAAKVPDYDPSAVFIHNVRIDGFANPFPLDLGGRLNYMPPGLADVEDWDDIAESIPGARAGVFLHMPPGSNSRERRDALDVRAMPRGDYGPMNAEFLRSFGPMQPAHLGNGLLPLPPEVMDKAGLQYQPAGMSPDIPNSWGVEGWVLVPHDHIIAWPMSCSVEERRAAGIVAWELRGKNVATNNIFTPYWLTTDVCVKNIVRSLTELVMSKADPRDVSALELHVVPMHRDKGWAHRDVVRAGLRDDEPLEEEEYNRRVQTPMAVTMRYTVEYACFPRGTANNPLLAPRLPPGYRPWRDYIDRCAATPPGPVVQGVFVDDEGSERAQSRHK